MPLEHERIGGLYLRLTINKWLLAKCAWFSRTTVHTVPAGLLRVSLGSLVASRDLSLKEKAVFQISATSSTDPVWCSAWWSSGCSAEAGAWEVQLGKASRGWEGSWHFVTTSQKATLERGFCPLGAQEMALASATVAMTLVPVCSSPARRLMPWLASD